MSSPTTVGDVKSYPLHARSDILVDLRLETQKQTGIRDFVETRSNATELFYEVQSALEWKQVNATHVSHPFWQVLVLKIEFR